MTDSCLLRAATAAVLLFALPPKAGAHDSAAPHFDLGKIIALDATITKFEFVNPHGYVFFTAPDAAGKPAAWRCELAAKVALTRMGWTQYTFRPGQHVTIKGSPARREENVCYLTSFITADGKEIMREAVISPETHGRGPAVVRDAGNRPERLLDGHPNLQGFWVSQDGPGGRGRGGRGRGGPGRPGGPGRGGQPELTAEGEGAGKGYDQRFDDPGLKCSISNIIFGWTHDQHVNEIVQKSDSITLNYG